MKPTGLFDLHCDTLTEGKYTVAGNPDTLDDPARVLSLTKIPKGTKWVQLYAIFIPDEFRGPGAIEYFNTNAANFDRQMAKFSDRVLPCRNIRDINTAFDSNRFGAILAVEGGAALAGDLGRVKVLADAGVRALTLVWNGENEIGSGNTTDKGLTEFGRKVIPELEEHGIIIDTSHLNDQGFEELLTIAKKTFIATHSNARALAKHKRNLTDAHIREIVARKGIVGLNFYVAFLRDDRNVQSLDDLYRHAMHFIELGASHNLALGSDFDGADLPECLNSAEKTLTIADYFLSRGMNQQLVDDIMFGNAYRFFEQNMK